KFAVLEGDPREEGVFTMRLRLPSGFQIKPHWHPAPERITVISGTFNMGRGDRFDTAQATALPAGSFTVIPAETWHYAWATGDTVLQITGGGPWQIIYLDPRDDPRKRGK
ncbi:MAG TPA: cupin domain-containing protein, partial [Thermoanaerobaculia bacterium]